MTLKPIKIDVDQTEAIYDNPDCREVFESYPAYYHKVGYHPPWIGYFVMRDDAPVGVCGFISQPADGRVELAYMTFKQHQNQGIASFACKELVTMAIQADARLTITAKTSPEENASTKILKRNGFKFSAIVQDEGIGDAWEWVYEGLG